MFKVCGLAVLNVYLCRINTAKPQTLNIVVIYADECLSMQIILMFIYAYVSTCLEIKKKYLMHRDRHLSR